MTNLKASEAGSCAAPREDSRTNQGDAVSCCLCSSSRVASFTRYQEYEIYRCTDCEVRFAVPFKQMDVQHYDEDYYIYQTRQFLTTYNPREMVGWISRRFFEVVPRFVQPKGKSLLDVGCGVGLLVHSAQKAGFDAYGIDFSVKSIQLGTQHLHLDGRLYCADLSQLGSLVGSRTFDVATIFEVLEHIEKPGQVLRDVHDRLSEGGLIAVSVPNADRFHLGADDTDCPPHHLTFWTKRAIRRLLEVNGFEIVLHEVEEKTFGMGLTKLYEQKVLGNPRLSLERKSEIHKAWAPIRAFLWEVIRQRNNFVGYFAKKLKIEGRNQLIMATKTLGLPKTT